jgi:hypothetical protein
MEEENDDVEVVGEIGDSGVESEDSLDAEKE